MNRIKRDPDCIQLPLVAGVEFVGKLGEGLLQGHFDALPFLI
jgi:hypothetical protein